MRDYVIFAVGESNYALAVEQVERIAPLSPLTPVPNAHPFVEGMMLYQNQTIKVVDFGKMTGIDVKGKGPENAAQLQKLLIYHGNGKFFAIKVDTIHDIVPIEESMIKHYSDTVKVGEYMQTEGVIEYKKRLVVVIKALELPKEEAE